MRFKRASDPETKVVEPVVGGEPLAGRRAEEDRSEEPSPPRDPAIRLHSARSAHTLTQVDNRGRIRILNASMIGKIDEAFDNFTRERPDALFVVPDAFLNNRRGQFATLTATPSYRNLDDREDVVVGGLMSYGTDKADIYHQVGICTGNILKGTKPSELPVVDKVCVRLMQTARALGIEVRPDVLSIADEVIE